MKKERAYDLPSRLLHWLFAGLFIAAFAVAKLTDDESPLFSRHMLLGLVLFCVTLLRVIWGFVGSPNARFSSFPLHPFQLASYLREVVSTRGRRYFGHNPASAWATIAMLGLALGLGVTGYLMATGNKEAFEDVHEILANAFAVVTVAHIAGLVLHSLRHRDGIALSMIHGKKESTEGARPIPGSHRLAALAMAGVVGAFASHVFWNYDAGQATTRVLGVMLQLGENESGEREHEEKGGAGQGQAEHEEEDD